MAINKEDIPFIGDRDGICVYWRVSLIPNEELPGFDEDHRLVDLTWIDRLRMVHC